MSTQISLTQDHRDPTYDHSFQDLPGQRLRLEGMRFFFFCSFAGMPLLEPPLHLELKAFGDGGLLGWRLLQSLCAFHDLFVQLQGLEFIAVIKTQGYFPS